MNRILIYTVLLLTAIFIFAPKGICENTKHTSAFPKKTAYITPFIPEEIKTKNINNIQSNINNLSSEIEIGTIKLEKGRRFIVISDRNLNSANIQYMPVKFQSIQKEYISYDKQPSKVIFQGKVEKTHKPRLAGKSGTIKIKLEKITIDKITYPVNALISKIDNKRVFFNTLSGTPVYVANLSETINNGTIDSQLKDPCINHVCTDKTYTKPFIFLGAAALQAADLLLSPIASLFKPGKELNIPEKTYFEIKLNKDLYVLNI